MDFKHLPLPELLQMASMETENDRLKVLIQEITERYAEQERHIVFEIFFGIQDKNAVWKESVTGLHAANERMRQIAADLPGAYFIFHSQSRKVMARLDNGPLKATLEVKPPKTVTG
jgi:hypothetical protein